MGVCTVDPALLELVKKLKFKSSAVGEAIVMKVTFLVFIRFGALHDHSSTHKPLRFINLEKVDITKQMVVEDEILEDVTIDELRESLSEHEPR